MAVTKSNGLGTNRPVIIALGTYLLPTPQTKDNPLVLLLLVLVLVGTKYSDLTVR